MIPREFLGAFKAGHRRSSREFIDEEFAEYLLRKIVRDGCEESKALLNYLTKFNNEFHKDVFVKDEQALHASEDQRRDCGRRNNSRNRDLFSSHDLIYFGKHLEKYSKS
jgi:hypothetical protein